MNIFRTHESAWTSAKFLDDKRVVKMALETCQILSAVSHRLQGQGWYKLTHANHPCTLWAGETDQNYAWTLGHFEALLSEYEYRFEREHACTEHFEKAVWTKELVTPGPLTPDPLCIAPDIKSIGELEGLDSRQLHRLNMLRKWQTDRREPVWTRRGAPEFWEVNGVAK